MMVASTIRPGAQEHAFLPQQGIHLGEQGLGQIVPLEQMAEAEQGGGVGHGLVA